MNESKNQNGFATIEIISVCAIIAILFSVVVPKLGKIIDKVELDCATKKLYGDLAFVQNVNRLARYNASIFDRVVTYPEKGELFVFVDDRTNYYDIRRRSTGGYENIRERRYLRNGMKISSNLGVDQRIDFNSEGISSFSGRVKFTSRRGNQVNMYFDSVGRFRGLWDLH